MAKKPEDTMLIFTADTVEAILKAGGSGDWVINPKRAQRMKFLICCRNQNWNNRREGFEHYSAFLIGKIAKLRQVNDSENTRGQPRFFVELSEYAPISIEAVWHKDRRNPVAYQSLSELGITLRSLKFQPMPAPTAVKSDHPLTIAEAKEALARTFGVKPDDIEITIRG